MENEEANVLPDGPAANERAIRSVTDVEASLTLL